MTVAGFLGRFQPLHKGHYKVIENYRKEFEEFKIIVGSADKSRTEENPLSFEERKELIHECFPDIEVLGLEDTVKTEEGNREWSENLAEIDIDVVISRNDLVKQILDRHTDIELFEQDLYDKEIYSGTEVRRRIKSKEEWRYLVPDCCKKKLEQLLENIKESGIKYDFEPGWKRENAAHGSYEK